MQTKKGSMFEVCCNVISGIITALLAWKYIIEPWSVSFCWDMNRMTIMQIVIMNGIFTIVSVVRGYFWRRLFNALS